jgi:hypothetical protein
MEDLQWHPASDSNIDEAGSWPMTGDGRDGSVIASDWRAGP